MCCAMKIEMEDRRAPGIVVAVRTSCNRARYALDPRAGARSRRLANRESQRRMLRNRQVWSSRSGGCDKGLGRKALQSRGACGRSPKQKIMEELLRGRHQRHLSWVWNAEAKESSDWAWGFMRSVEKGKVKGEGGEGTKSRHRSGEPESKLI